MIHLRSLVFSLPRIKGAIEHPASESFPAGDKLDFVEEKSDRMGGAELGMLAVVFLQEKREIGSLHADESVVLEVEEHQRFSRSTRFEKVSAALPQKAGFTAATHADDGQRFARNLWKPDLPMCQQGISVSGAEANFSLRVL
jgi:hypothetical protein